MEETIKWRMENYGLLLAGFMFLEKIVKLTKWKWDDILLDMILTPVFNVVKGGKVGYKKLILLITLILIANCSKKVIQKPPALQILEGIPTQETVIVPDPIPLLILDPENPPPPGIVYFNFDSDTLTKRARKVLSIFIQGLVRHPRSQVLLEGGCCPIGTIDYNLRLGMRRGGAVYDFMHTALPKQDILIVSRGEFALDTHSPKLYYLNRNCKFTVTTGKK